ncbi:MAG: L-2-amino-thiazoline-4-carboxylic acid hydrolase [Erysipelotrichaceae bacterium]|nr:L-2-amino-thiazoline-4-carboxylic acid hydrolase [Erysipelotrichaceae bacterium]
MKMGLMGYLFPLLLNKTVYDYTQTVLPELDIRDFRRKHKREYRQMINRTPSIGSVKDNMFTPVVYLACYGFTYYKSDPEKITMDVFDGMIEAICKSETMKKFYKGKNCFDRKEIDKYVKGSIRSKKREYPNDWVFDFSYDLSIPEYYVTHHECGVCKIAQAEDLMFLMPHICVMDYPTIEYKGGKLIRTKTLGNGDECCDFHVVKKEEVSGSDV